MDSTSVKQPYQVLVVDDIAVNRTLIKSILPEAEFTITEAADGDDALSLIAKQDFDVVLLDVMMPGKDGITACQQLRRGSIGKHLPVIMMSSLSPDQALDRAFDAGADDFLHKPFNFNELMARIKVLAGRYRAFLTLAHSIEALDMPAKQRTA